MRPLGIDFGTTNSAVALATSEGDVRLARFGEGSTFRSVLYFEPDGPRVAVSAGPEAIARRLAGEGEGRLVQSLKSHLASRLFDKTIVFGRTYTLEDLVGTFLVQLRAAAERDLGPLPTSGPIVVGRPVHFASAENEDDDAYAVERLRAAFARAGFERVVLEPEPLAAAYAYERALDHDERVLVADFGGGTSDFCLLEVGPSRRSRGREGVVLGTDGVGLAGDAFDGEVVMHAIAPALGLGSRYRMRTGDGTLEIPSWIYGRLRKWHHLSFLRSKETMALLDDLRKQSLEPEKIRALIHVVEADLGFHLYRAVERTKIALGSAGAARLSFVDDPVAVEADVDRASFERWIVPPLSAIAASLDRLLAKTGTSERDVDAVFMTGGTSLVPAVRRVFAERFGEERLRGGDELVSVAVGLALRARDLASA